MIPWSVILNKSSCHTLWNELLGMPFLHCSITDCLKGLFSGPAKDKDAQLHIFHYSLPLQDEDWLLRQFLSCTWSCQTYQRYVHIMAVSFLRDDQLDDLEVLAADQQWATSGSGCLLLNRGNLAVKNLWRNWKQLCWVIKISKKK